MKFKKVRRTAKDILDRYKAGERNFQNSDLKGLNFYNQKLVDIDFSHSDIRGANFSETDLTRALFYDVEAGIIPAIGFILMTISLLISFTGCALAAISGILLVRFLEPNTSQPVLAFLFLWIITTIILYLMTWTSQQLSQRGIFALKLSIANLIAILSASLGLILGAFGSVRFILLKLGNSVPYINIYDIFKYLLIVLLIIALGQSIVTGLSITKTFAYLTYKHIIFSDSSIVFGFLGIIAGILAISEQPLLIPSLMLSLPPLFIGNFCGQGAIKGNSTWASTRNIVIFFASFFSTNFRGAILTEVDFRRSNLGGANFSQTQEKETVFTQIYWKDVKGLEFANLGNSILTNNVVRELLVNLDGYKKLYIGANLRGANLKGAALRGANLKGANISNATFQDADLADANLALVEAISTDFTCAIMTGACVEAWNIESSTKLNDVDCQFIYLLELPDPVTGTRERRPSSGHFAPGDFTKLFQEIISTVDLIFSQGVDWKAFTTAFKKVQFENEDTEFTIQSFQDKGDGVVVITINVPLDTNKEKIHKELIEYYENTIKKLEKNYQTQLEESKVIIDYREQLKEFNDDLKRENSELKKIIAQMAEPSINVPVNEREVEAIAERQTAINLVILTLGLGDFEKGFSSVIAQIWTGNDRLPIQRSAELPPIPGILKDYQNWQLQYERFIRGTRDIRQRELAIATSTSDFNFNKLAEELEEKINKWLNAELFLPIDRILRERFNRSDEIRIIIQSDDIHVRRLPWHLWDFLKPYRKAEVALSSSFSDRSLKTTFTRNKIRVLSILGDNTGINYDKEKELLAQINVEPTFLVKPSIQKLDENLWSEQGWDILCFSGHSSSEMDGTNGYIKINDTERLTISEIRNALQVAIERGLQIAIFNSCDGLGLANQLASLHISQIIVMRAPVPDAVAQEFFKNFLTAFASGKSFYLAVREAREKLQKLENLFPCASWLPVICQNAAEDPPTWQTLPGGSHTVYPHQD